MGQAAWSLRVGMGLVALAGACFGQEPPPSQAAQGAPGAAPEAVQGTVVALKAAREGDLSTRDGGLNCSWSGWKVRPEGTLGRFGLKERDPIYRQLYRFEWEKVPSTRRLLRVTFRLNISVFLQGSQPVVPLMSFYKLPAEATLAKFPEEGWGAMNGMRDLGSMPIMGKTVSEWSFTGDSPMGQYIQAQLKVKKNPCLILGLKAATEQAVLYTIKGPLQMDLQFAEP